MLASDSRDALNELRQTLRERHREALTELRDVVEAEKEELRESLRDSKRQKVKLERENVPPPAAPTPIPKPVYAPPQQVRQMPQMQMNLSAMAPMPPQAQYPQQQYMQRTKFGGAWPRQFGY